MGAFCCCCRPKTQVTDNRDVLLSAKVGTFAYSTNLSSTFVGGGISGLLYILDNQLCYEIICGSRLCCKCCRKRWDLSQVKEITLIRNEVVRIRQASNYVSLTPGLRVTFFGQNNATMLVAMPDAVSFSCRLAQHLTGQPLEEEDFKDKMNVNVYTANISSTLY